MEKPPCMFCRYRKSRRPGQEACCPGDELLRRQDAAACAPSAMETTLPERLRPAGFPRPFPQPR